MTAAWEEIKERLMGDTTTVIINVVIIVLIFILAHIVMMVVSRQTKRTIDSAEKMTDKERSKKIITSMTITRSVARYIVYFIAILLVLNLLGLGASVNNILVTAGIGSLFISLGAQSIIKDILAGLFMMFENQYSVGDYVTINNYTGTVTSVAMRVTYLRNFEGQQVIIPNGQITSVVNYGNTYNTAKVVVPTPYEGNTREIMNIITDEVNRYYEEHKDLFYEAPKVMGISAYSDSSVDITVVAKAMPLKHWEVEREFKLIIKERLDKEGISIPYQQVVIHKGE